MLSAQPKRSDAEAGSKGKEFNPQAFGYSARRKGTDSTWVYGRARINAAMYSKGKEPAPKPFGLWFKDASAG